MEHLAVSGDSELEKQCAECSKTCSKPCSSESSIPLTRTEILEERSVGETPPSVDSLPPHLLSLIFKSWWADNDISYPKSSGIPAVTLACKSWLKTAFSTPDLWTRITISHPQHIPFLGDLLTRSMPCNIDVHLNLLDPEWQYMLVFPPDEEQGWPLMRNLLDEHLSRCKRITIRSNSDSPGVPAVLEGSLFEWPMPLLHLEELAIERSGYSFPRGPEPIFPKGLPTLKTLKMGIFFTLPTDTYKKLTSLHIYAGAMILEQFRYILSKCTSLETLAVFGTRFGSSLELDADLTPVNLPHLSALRLFDVHDYFISYILSMISAPYLSNLVLVRFSAKAPHTFNFLPEDIHRWPSVVKLTLTMDQNPQVAKYAVRMAAKCFLNVEEITFVGSGVQAGLGALQESIENHVAFSGLKSIAFVQDACDEDPVLWEKLFQARANSGLDKIYLSKWLYRNVNQPWLESMSKRIKVEMSDSWEKIINDGLLYPSHLYGV